MRKHGLRLTFLTILTLVAFLSSATAQESLQNDRGPHIEEIDVVPGEIGHGDDVYVGVKVVDSGSSVEDVWFTARSDGQRVARKGLWDSNHDDYYASPVSFKAEGGKDYSLELNACNTRDECSTRKIDVSARCELDFLGDCLY